MMYELSGLSTINVELTSRCDKNCWMCGRRKIDRDYPEIAMNYGDMPFDLVRNIANQLPPGIVVQFHNNGESLLYPQLGEALSLFQGQIKCLNTNAKLLVKKADEIIGNLHTLTISVIENDPEGDEQYELVNEFLSIKHGRRPLMVYRLLGNVEKRERWEKLPGTTCSRVLHHPMGSFQYKKSPTKPEIGVCWDFLHHMAINRFGVASICVRFDPHGEGVIGNVGENHLHLIWRSGKRLEWMSKHLQGRRNEIPLCSKCEFWGVPTGMPLETKEENNAKSLQTEKVK